MIAKIAHPNPSLTLTSRRSLTWPIIGNMPEMRAVITDWGGVLTQPIGDTVRDWIAADQIDWDSYVAVVGPWLKEAYDEHDGHHERHGHHAFEPLQATGMYLNTSVNAGVNNGVNPVHALERGECAVADFERLLAERLVTTTGGKVIADGLLTRMLSAERPDPVMYQVIRDLRGQGVRTALLSNSWGKGTYRRQDFPGLFDAVVISGEVGMRKPEPRIFLHTAELLNVAPVECVFVDDLEANVRAAAGCGMTGLHHTDPADTVVRLTELFAAR
jgi:putative hydrolase of the HAD superfamily